MTFWAICKRSFLGKNYSGSSLGNVGKIGPLFYFNIWSHCHSVAARISRTCQNLFSTFENSCYVKASGMAIMYSCWQCIKTFFEQYWQQGCGSVGRVVASDTSYPWFESRHWPIVISINCFQKTKQKMIARMAHLKILKTRPIL